MLTILTKTHDLLELESSQCIRSGEGGDDRTTGNELSIARSNAPSNAPEWVSRALVAAPFVVVRRAPILNDSIPVGVRGFSRNERWAGFVDRWQVKKIVRPEQLRLAGRVSANRLKTIIAMQHLEQLERLWDERSSDGGGRESSLSRAALVWGPGGSVGFELASGVEVATEASDLDIVLLAPEPFDVACAGQLLSVVDRIASSIDVVVEAPHCGFSLREFAVSRGQPVLLRTNNGPRFGSQPWRRED